MIDQSLDSDGELCTEAQTSSQSSTSSTSCTSCSSFSRHSFDACAAALPPPEFPSRPSSKPHRSSDSAWAAIRLLAASGEIGSRDFRLLRRIGNGDIGTVYICCLGGDKSHQHFPSSVYAMKVVNKQALEQKKKLGRADTERRILRGLDHPFLPTLYAEFDASPHHSCAVMDYCSGGDLHSLRHRQPGHRFSLPAARFYAAEVLLALEYLHMLGIVYRDLKPENILIRSDGHIMLSDFDLSIESSTSPSVELAGVSAAEDSILTPCLPNRLCRSKKSPLPRFVAEPVVARSNSFVGTHEYVAPEMAAGGVHGSAVDWWAYGVFIYELIYGRTPFAGPTNAVTLRNILKQQVTFPRSAEAGGDRADVAAARTLITGLLVKDPAMRLGSRGGATDVKMHPFFKRINFALLRSCRPPLVPGPARTISCRDLQPAAFDYF